MGLDPRHLRMLRLIAEHGSFSRAADVQGLSQPALSSGIARLERQIGVRVLDRTPQGATPNDFGAILLRHARALEHLLEQAEAEVAAKKSGGEGPLSVAGTPYGIVYLLPSALGLLEAQGVSPRMQVFEAEDASLDELLRTWRAELAIGTIGQDPPSPDVEDEPLVEVPFDLVVRPDNRWAPHGEISLAALEGARWAMPMPGGSFRRQIDSVFLTAGVPLPADVLVCPTIGVIKEVVAHTGRVALLPRHAVDLECRAGSLARVRLTERTALRRVGLRRLKGRALSPVAEQFRAAMRATCAPLGEDAAGSVSRTEAGVPRSLSGRRSTRRRKAMPTP